MVYLGKLNHEIHIRLKILSKFFEKKQFKGYVYILFRYLYGVLNRNPTVSDANRDLLIETLRCISEILIWGDQNDSSVFE
jgi:hypothetical protein